MPRTAPPAASTRNGFGSCSRSPNTSVASVDYQPEANPLTPRTIDPVLSSVLDEGLERHEGQYLRDTELTLYLHLLARGYQPNGRRVCERCQIVFRDAVAAPDVTFYAQLERASSDEQQRRAGNVYRWAAYAIAPAEARLQAACSAHAYFVASTSSWPRSQAEPGSISSPQ